MNTVRTKGVTYVTPFALLRRLGKITLNHGVQIGRHPVRIRHTDLRRAQQRTPEQQPFVSLGFEHLPGSVQKHYQYALPARQSQVNLFQSDRLPKEPFNQRPVISHDRHPRRAASIAAMSIFVISIIASKARLAAARSGSAIAAVSARGVICHDRPHLSLHHPQALS